jgi:hypothetical protein
MLITRRDRFAGAAEALTRGRSPTPQYEGVELAVFEWLDTRARFLSGLNFFYTRVKVGQIRHGVRA